MVLPLRDGPPMPTTSGGTQRHGSDEGKGEEEDEEVDEEEREGNFNLGMRRGDEVVFLLGEEGGDVALAALPPSVDSGASIWPASLLSPSQLSCTKQYPKT